jgi:transposase
MAKEYTKHDEEFKKMIVNLCETNKDKTMSDIAREYGITRTSITNWRKKYGTIITSTGEVTNNDELLKLKKRNHELEQENEILKKAVAIFSKK